MNLPTQSNGDYKYHVHDQPVITDCASTLAHLDPFIRGQKVSCDINRPASCEVGDLSGKHGAIPGSGGEKIFLFIYIYKLTILYYAYRNLFKDIHGRLHHTGAG